eukprot:1141855-Pelagomonas_calceolata.AAC.3
MTPHHFPVQAFTNRERKLLHPTNACRGHGTTNTINRADLAGILVALQKGQTDVASDSVSCLPQVSK